jgi:MoxR-like ATPase
MSQEVNQETNQDALADAQSGSLQATNRLIAHARGELGKVISGQTAAIEEILFAVLCQGHALLEGVPGIAKTLMVKALGRLLGLGFQRVQATPDLMPADILGTTILRPGTDSFTFHAGPVFTDLLLVDEINRMPPRTQAALLECMEERQVTIDGQRRPLPSWFTVFATQNPVDFEGTYPLPEAQLDRFLVRVRTGYPSPADERALIARAVAGFDARDLDAAGVRPVVARDELLAAQRAVRTVHLADSLQAYVYDIVAATRSSPDVALGASPRAGLALVVAAQAAAQLDGRTFATPDDVKDVGPAVLAHRIIVRPEAELDGTTADAVIARVLTSVAAPAT